MSDGKDYKATLNLPQTEFPMKGSLNVLEPKLLEKWEQEKIFDQVLKKNAGRPEYVLHDGPPYANGNLHAGHALNKVLKDIVVKFRNLAGNRADYVPGWDCHGLPIEQAVEKRLREQKIDKRTMSRDEFLEKCRQYALEFIDVQRGQFKRMGVLGRWNEPYRTLSFDYEAQEIRELAKIAAQGVLYRKKRPVYWCITDMTALAEAEVEYEDHTSPSVYVAFEAAGPVRQVPGKKVSFVIWTTTPWTLPANLAISVHPKFEYVFYALAQRVVCVAKDLLLHFLSQVAPDELKVQKVTLGTNAFDASALVDPTRILAYASGEELKGLEYQHVFYPRRSPILTGEHVTLEAGTGLVHTAPGHGQEDYAVGIEASLDIYNPVKNDGRYDETVGEKLTGMKVWDANPVVIEMLREKGALLQSASLSHSYPHCWRCHNPVVFRATHQWFISLDQKGLRKQALQQVDEVVKWVPDWGRDRIRGMLETRPDWCISRQRTWGVPIPIARCEKCDDPFIDQAFMNRVADAVEKSGAGIWYSAAVTDFLPPGHTCKCGNATFVKETDILDVWFDSACSFASVKPPLPVPVDLYLEGTDQHRGWFHSSLLVGVATRGIAPYKSCLTHGFLIDGKGEPMSKSKGNVVPSDDIIKQYGAEVMRLWVASSDYSGDVTVSKPIFEARVEAYRKIRNTLRYALSNLYDFDPAADAVPPEKLLPLDAWARAKLDALVARVRSAYEKFEFHTVYHSVVDFCAATLSAEYFDIQKDTLYASKKTGLKRRSAQTVLYEVTQKLLVLLAPVTTFTAEEAWGYLPGQKPASVLLAELPVALGLKAPEDIERLLKVRETVLPVLEVARRDKLIGKSEDAKVVLAAKDRAFFEKHLAVLPELFKVSQVELSDAAEHQVVKADGNKCPRCWLYKLEVGKQELCNRCVEATT
ncbi:MAG: isoleucine--tRNA ligase [Archangiaceae bacterium]|nr:isoleucine--tRNA ligase [Archangiaceae bacterium]